MSYIPPPAGGTHEYIPNHLVWSILSTLFCCLPLGIVSIVYASQVDGKRAAGDIAGAREASGKAKFWAMLSAGLALIPRSMLESMPGHQQVSAWPLAEEWRWLTTWLVWRRGAKTRQLEAFIALLNEDRQAAVSP